jgi:hypothetical protein
VERKRIDAAAEMLAAHLGSPVRIEATERTPRPR